MLKNITIENVQDKKGEILDMIIMGIPHDIPEDMNDAYLLSIPNVLAAEYLNKNRIEMKIMIFASILEGVFGLSSEIFQEILVQVGFMKTLIELEEIKKQHEYIDYIYNEIYQAIKEKNSTGMLINNTILGLIEKLDEKIDIDPEHIDKLSAEFRKTAQDMGITPQHK